MKSPVAVLQMLQVQRRRATAGRASTGQFGVAVCEVLDELIRRTQVIVSQYPEDQDMTLTIVREMPAVVGALKVIIDTVDGLGEVVGECAEGIGARRDPVLKFVARIESEGFDIAQDWTLIDTHTWTPVDDTADPDLLVQREAEKITRAERATAYHERLVRMATAFEEAVAHYTQRVRNLIPNVLDG